MVIASHTSVVVAESLGQCEVKLLLKAEALVHKSLQAGLIQNIEGQLFVEKHGKG
jgi:hypothetical protein